MATRVVRVGGEAGGSAHVYGVSSGAALVLEAAAAGVTVDGLAVYEVPYNTADDWPQRWRAYVERLQAALARGHGGEAVELFLRLVDTSDDDVAQIKDSPYWPSLEAIAHTQAYDAASLEWAPPAATRTGRAIVTRRAVGGRPSPTLYVRGRAPRPDGVLLNSDVLPRLRQGSFEHARARRLIEASAGH
jgi:hypothetical protein